jgi:hypothetical protein
MCSLYCRELPLVVDSFEAGLFGVRPCRRGACGLQSLFPGRPCSGNPPPSVLAGLVDEGLKALLDVEEVTQSLVVSSIDRGIHEQNTS